MKLVSVGKDKFAKVDNRDFELVSQYRWSFDGRYAVSAIKKKTIRMHSLIMNTPKGLVTDHINRDTLDNQRINLQVCSQSFNAIRSGLKKPRNRSGFKGVYWFASKRKWRAEIMSNYVKHYIGDFTCPIEAAKAYDKAALELHGDHAYQNFPEKKLRERGG